MEHKYQEAQAVGLKNLGFEEAQVYLKSTGVYEHISAVLLKLSLDKPKNALEIFEHVSSAVKSSSVKLSSGNDELKINEASEKREVNAFL